MRWGWQEYVLVKFTRPGYRILSRSLSLTMGPLDGGVPVEGSAEARDALKELLETEVGDVAASDAVEEAVLPGMMIPWRSGASLMPMESN